MSFSDHHYELAFEMDILRVVRDSDRSLRFQQRRDRHDEDLGIFRRGPVAQMTPIVPAYGKNFGRLARAEQFHTPKIIFAARFFSCAEQPSADLANRIFLQHSVSDLSSTVPVPNVFHSLFLLSVYLSKSTDSVAGSHFIKCGNERGNRIMKEFRLLHEAEDEVIRLHVVEIPGMNQDMIPSSTISAARSSEMPWSRSVT